MKQFTSHNSQNYTPTCRLHTSNCHVKCSKTFSFVRIKLWPQMKHITYK